MKRVWKTILTAILAGIMVLGVVGCSADTAAESAAGTTAAEGQQAAETQAVQETADTGEAAPAEAAGTGDAVKPPKNGDKYVIGVSVPAPDNQWVAAIIDNAQQQAKKANESGKFEITVTTANNPAKQVSDVEDLLTKEPDAMVIFPIESAPLTPIAEQVKEQGIPLMILTRGIESTKYDSYIRGDDRVVGISAAHYIGQRLNGKGNVVMMQAAPSAITTERTEGFEETLAANYPDIKIIATGNGNFAREPAMKEMENILQAQPQIDAVYSEDDEQALGCITAIKNAGRESEMFVTGVGGNKSVLEALMDNDPLMAATFFYSPLQGGSAVELAQLMAQDKGMSDLWEKSIPREIIFAADTITSENAADYYDENSQY
ncbi:substrate-binding domain-containing protein [Christensenella intestinihominis]|uniref:substrate-binding domain-containing protein n=1 Tax=Christensenella intestinihominis TaxID=1851429 RepID=UPI00082F4B0B|nr:substrate-binding domain-containing protein [Christensenella intestinihominis]